MKETAKNEIYSFHKKFWEKRQDSILPRVEEEWLVKYAEEILQIIGPSNLVIDAGCGAGEITCQLAQHINQIIAFDYSESMFEQANERKNAMGINNVELSKNDLLSIDKVTDKQVDAIFSSGVVQYLSLDQIDEVLKKATKMITSGGKIALMNIPNDVFRDLYRIGIYHQKRYIPFTKYIKGYFHVKLIDMINKLRTKKYVSDGIGYWYLMTDFEKLAEQNGLKIDVFFSKYPPFGYRFHAVFTK